MTVNSREVAENFGKEHSGVLKIIEGENRKGVHINGLKDEILASGNPLTKYFIESTYENRGKDYKQYLLTRDGFSLIVMGFTGIEALQWKIKYIDAFNKMEENIKLSLQRASYLIGDPIERAKAWIKEQEEKIILIGQVEELSPLAELARKRLDKEGTVSITDMTKTYNLKRGQITTWAKVKGYIHKSIQEVNKAGEKFFKVVDGNGHNNVAILEDGIKEIDKNIEEIKGSPVSYKKVATE